MAEDKVPRRSRQEEMQPPGSAALAAKFQNALALHRRGELDQAKRLYREILALAPDHFDALHSLGVIEGLKNNAAGAAQWITQAVRLNPHDAFAQSNLGNALLALGRIEEALACYDRALALKPDLPGALNGRGAALADLKRPVEALASYDLALRLKPDYVQAVINRGNALFDLKRPEEALASYDRALVLEPDHVDALNGRGNALLDLKRPEEALATYDRTLQLQPDYVEALNNRGNALLDLKRPEEALATYHRALQLQPDDAETLNNCGAALRELKRPEEALATYNRALQLQPDDAETLNNCGAALRELKRPEEALATYNRALQFQPDYVEALNNRGIVQRDLKRYEDAARSYARLLELTPDFAFAKGDLLHAKMLCCDWTDFDSLAKSIEKDIRAGKQSAEPFGYQAVSDSARDLKRCAEIYAAEKFPRTSVELWRGERYDNARIRIGYVSGEFRNQATAILMAGLFELHDKKRFELFAFDNGWDDASEIRGRIKRAFDEIVDITRSSDREAAAAISQRRIDILVNLNGYFGRARQGIFSYRPCPVQVNYLGFPGTIGADYIDYILADKYVIPEDQQVHYTEKVVYLPDTYQVNDSKRPIAKRVPTRTELKLPNEGFVFCCFNNNYKIAPHIFDIWMRLLKKIEASVLWLLEDNAAASRNLRREADQRGVSPERLVFAPRMKLDEHLARHKLADLFLDTLPYNAHTTASDALWAGLPLLTCQGKTFPGRVATSLLNAVGLPELITHDLEEYEAMALKLAANPDVLAEIKAKLARQRTSCALFDTDRFRRNIELAYIMMWERNRRGDRPASFAVADPPGAAMR